MNLKTLTYADTINEKISFSYKIPKNKAQLMYDFYLLTALPTWSLGGGNKRPQPEAPAMKQLLEPVQKNLVNYLKKDLLDAVFFAIASEFRHYMAFEQYKEIEKTLNFNDFMKWFKKLPLDKSFSKQWKEDERIGKATPSYNFYLYSYLESDKVFYSNRGRNQSHDAALASGLSKDKFVKMALIAFDKGDWGAYSDYGGPAWANIARGWQKLNKASSYEDKVVYIDHIFDLQHNTDSVLNKSKEYADSSGSYRWIATALDVKKHATSLFDLVDDASPAAKSFSARLIKAATGDTYDAYMKRYRDLTAAIR